VIKRMRTDGSKNSEARKNLAVHWGLGDPLSEILYAPINLKYITSLMAKRICENRDVLACPV